MAEDPSTLLLRLQLFHALRWGGAGAGAADTTHGEMAGRNEQMIEAAENGDRAALERHINDGADIESTDHDPGCCMVRRPSAAGLWRPSTTARASLRTPRRRGRTMPLPPLPSRPRPPPRCRLLSLAALPLQCG